MTTNRLKKIHGCADKYIMIGLISKHFYGVLMRQIIIWTLVLLYASACSTHEVKANSLELNPKRLIEVIDVIDGSQLHLAQKIDALSSESSEPIDILVNSPGGSVLVGYMIVDSIKLARSRGVNVRCAVGILAASMAFNLLASCTERYALPHAVLLFHPPRIQTNRPLTVVELQLAYEDLSRTMRNTTPEIQSMLGMQDEEFNHHFFGETAWTAQELLAAAGHEWIKIIDDISGSKLVFTPERPRDLGIFGQLMPKPQHQKDDAPFTIIYVSPVPELNITLDNNN